MRASDGAAPQYQQPVDDQTWRIYVDSLRRLTERDRQLIVGRSEFGYTYRELALIEQMPSADAARKALGRALRRLVELIANP